MQTAPEFRLPTDCLGQSWMQSKRSQVSLHCTACYQTPFMNALSLRYTTDLLLTSIELPLFEHALVLSGSPVASNTADINSDRAQHMDAVIAMLRSLAVTVSRMPRFPRRFAASLRATLIQRQDAGDGHARDAHPEAILPGQVA